MSKMFTNLNVENILALSNGLAFLAMVLAFWLINGVIKKIKAAKKEERLPRGTVALVTLYLAVSVLFVAVGTMMQILTWKGAAVDLNVSSTEDFDSLKEMKLDDKFKVIIVHNGVRQNIVEKPYKVRLVGGIENISLNAESLIWYINGRNTAINELMKRLENKNENGNRLVNPALSAAQ